MNEKIKSFQVPTYFLVTYLSMYCPKAFNFFLLYFFSIKLLVIKFYIPNFYSQRILWEYDVDNFTFHFVNMFYKRPTDSIFPAKERLMFREIVESSQQILFLLLFLPKYLQLKKFLLNLLCKKIPQQLTCANEFTKWVWLIRMCRKMYRRFATNIEAEKRYYKELRSHM